MNLLGISAVAFLAIASISPAPTASAESQGTTTQTVGGVYPALVGGALSYAILDDLPRGRILESGSLTISEGDLESSLATLPADVQEEMRRNLASLLEQRATRDLLLRLAKEQSEKGAGANTDEDASIREYLEKAVGDIQVGDAEVAKFYEDNKDMCGGLPLDQIEGELKQYMLQKKRREAVNEHIRTLGRRRRIVVSAGWIKQQAAPAMDNAVDKARASGRPTLVDFGADGCGPCDMMTPIIEDIKAKYDGKMNVEFVHVREQPVLAARYGIESIPVQVLFDKGGKEVWRHTGFIPQVKIEDLIEKVGVR
ncbi:thioredoxin family protein [Candidatus Sumerlaeota bacterium]|nr:thioredoxin family protein [Candidatus Sumerlaeota bacterium]